ncbi:MAG: GAF domain-containing protein [Segniliparus sp.]|uniref:GAF domain-containing protein n=1 Tax=Segniliparus sp. TaxID=2804064 RepID=UPI003F2C8DBE
MSDSSPQFRDLAPELDQIAKELDVRSVLIMRSTPAHMRVEATAGEAEAVYTVGAEGRKGAVFEDAHELYCERVVNTGQALFVRDSAEDPEFAGNEDEAEHGLNNYLGVPVLGPDGSVFGTVCVLDDKARDYTPEQRARLDELRAAAERALASD